MTRIKISMPSGKPANGMRFAYYFCNANGQRIGDVKLSTSSEFTVTPPRGTVYCAVRSEGFWTKHQMKAGDCFDIVLPKLPLHGPLGWWHHFHGIDKSDADRGNGVRIGVIDIELATNLGPSDVVRHVTNLGFGPLSEERENPEGNWHARAVTSLLAAKPNKKAAYEGMAPGAEVLFMAARSQEQPGKASSIRVANAIDHLSIVHECDLITISFGDYANPLRDIENSILRARAHGTACFFAAGNKREILYPARYDAAISVGAIGKFGTAPRETEEFGEENFTEPLSDGEHFLWSSTPRGPEIQLAAAGVNVFYNKGIVVCEAVTGTSFAAPIAAGVAAAILSKAKGWREMPRDSNRWDKIVDILSSQCNTKDGNKWANEDGGIPTARLDSLQLSTT